jgi:GNAT superfamily N-acetyltransferase
MQVRLIHQLAVIAHADDTPEWGLHLLNIWGESRSSLPTNQRKSQARRAFQVAAFHQDAIDYPDVATSGPPGYDSTDIMREKITQHHTYRIVVVGAIVDVIFIDPDWHNQGIGSAAMQFLDAHYGASRWTLHTPTYALRNQHFYEKFGYLKVGEETIDDFRLFAYERKPAL